MRKGKTLKRTRTEAEDLCLFCFCKEKPTEFLLQNVQWTLSYSPETKEDYTNNIL